MVPGLCLQLRPKDVVRGEALVVLLEMDQAKTRIEGLEFEAPLLVARPLPSGVDPLGIEDMVRRQQKARCEELEQTLVLPLPFHTGIGTSALAKASIFSHSSGESMR